MLSSDLSDFNHNDSLATAPDANKDKQAGFSYSSFESTNDSKEKEESKKHEGKKLMNLAKEYNYFTSDETEKVSNMAGVEKICEVYSYEQIKELNKKLESNSSTAKDIFLSALKQFNDKIETAQMTTNASDGGKKRHTEKLINDNEDLSEDEPSSPEIKKAEKIANQIFYIKFWR